MSTALTALEEALMENDRLMEIALKLQQYDQALLYMNDRLVLIEKLTQLAKEDPTQQWAVSSLAGILASQEENLKHQAFSHYRAILEELQRISRANRAGKAYRVNSKEF